MKVKRVFAKDMHRAIRKIREELGPDAVILSNQKVDGGVEILAAIDFDAALVAKAAANCEPTQPITTTPQPQWRLETRAAANKPAATCTAASRAIHRAELQTMRKEISKLRGVMQSQLEILGWGRWSRQSPLRASVLKRLTRAGLGSDLAKEIVHYIAGIKDLDKAWQRALGILAHQIKVTNNDIVNQGGIIALVGATGVGKTTTIAKLAARFAMHHGARHVALVSTDNFRIGGRDQLMTYGRILGVPVFNASDRRELREILQGTRKKRLVMIDTVGMGQRDVRLFEQFAKLRDESLNIDNYLVLSANTQLSGLEDTVRTFAKVPLKGCIITKTDEAGSLGGVLTVAAKQKLPVAYISNGQSVPEDIEPARAHRLVSKTIALANRSANIDDISLAITYGRMVANART